MPSAPLGLAAFGFTTFLLSFVNAGILSGTAVSVVMPLAFSYGGFAQLLTFLFIFSINSEDFS